jgi:siroheme synthase-like protein
VTHSSFPVNLNLSGKPCLVIGEGAELMARVQTLLEAGADVEIVSEAPADAVRELERARALRLHQRSFEAADLENKWLCVLVGASAERARAIGEAAERARVLFCATDAPAHNSFSHMALARAGQLVIATATGGHAPALARRLREELQRLLDECGMASFVERLADLRRQTPSNERRTVLNEAVAPVRFTGKLVIPE